MKFKEIHLLKEMLEKAKIPFEFAKARTLQMKDKGKENGYQILYPNSSDTVCSVTQSIYTDCLNKTKTLEIMGLLTPVERKTDNVCSNLLADEVFNRISKHYSQANKKQADLTAQRIICDKYIKSKKRIWGNDADNPFNKKIVAVNNMYAWLYNQGILKEVSFEYIDDPDATYFAFDTESLKPYKDLMEHSGVVESALSIKHIFEEKYTPCLYTGAIELSWTMSTYRDNCGCVGKSWECCLARSFDNQAVQKAIEVKQNDGVKAAVSMLFSLYES